MQNPDQALADLLAQCDREDHESGQGQGYLYTDEIRRLLAAGQPADQ